jgi:hypothetical protein
LPVVKRNEHFVGLLTHAAVLELLEEAWGLNRGSYTLTVGSYGTQGTLKKMTSIAGFLQLPCQPHPSGAVHPS